MRIATRFSIAVHELSLLGMEVTPSPASEFMAASIGIHPVVARSVLGMLRRAGLVDSRQGKAGAQLTKPLGEITLLEVLRAVEPKAGLFAMHQNPLPECPVGRGIQGALEGVFCEAQRAMEDRLAHTTMEDIVARIKATA